MAKHDELLQQGPHEAPEPETAEERSKRLGAKGVAGGAAAGGVALAKLGFLTKFLIWIFAWHGAVDLWRVGGWIAVVAVLGVITIYLVLRSRRQA